ncbi:hypothetical protein [Streptomonospora salina]|uniref:Uncharacterized protein n=1 Tax=Streptomonospora salina TaxID=104205 RepID=A0A841EFV4_9ACTN|nr:hypothetical protein [Streptomonospora salina]MBB6000219.1 hypothetical protein [Streptomonospora salina]
MPELTANDIATRTGRTFTTAQEAQVQAWIGDAIAQASPHVRALDAADLRPGAHATLAAAVARCVYNPSGLKSYSAGAVSFTAGPAAAGGNAGPVLAPADIDAIRAAYGKAPAYSVRTPSRRAYQGDDPPASALDAGGEAP